MIKKSIIFFVIVFVSFFIYQKKFKNTNLEIWDLVPAKSVMIIEINDPLDKWNKFSSSVNEDQFRDFRKLIDKNISELNSFLNNKLNVLVDNNNLIVSVSKTSKEDFDLLFTSNSKNLDFQYVLKKQKIVCHLILQLEILTMKKSMTFPTELIFSQLLFSIILYQYLKILYLSRTLSGPLKTKT